MNKEARPLDFSKCGLCFRLLSQKLSKIKALAGAAVLASGPAPGMCLGQVPPHASLSSQAGPHLMLLISHWRDTEFAQTVAKDSPCLTFKSTYKWMASQTVSPSPRPSHSTGFPMVTGSLHLESPVWGLRSALGAALGTVNLWLVPLCLCLLSSSTSGSLST